MGVMHSQETIDHCRFSTGLEPLFCRRSNLGRYVKQVPTLLRVMSIIFSSKCKITVALPLHCLRYNYKTEQRFCSVYIARGLPVLSAEIGGGGVGGRIR